MTREEYI